MSHRIDIYSSKNARSVSYRKEFYNLWHGTGSYQVGRNFGMTRQQWHRSSSVFLLSSGEILGAVHHVSPSERDQLRIDLLSDEAMKTSAIEGEILDRQSVQSSLRRHLGLSPDSYPTKPREQGVAEMMVDVYSTYAAPLTHETLFRWHSMLLSHDRPVGQHWGLSPA